jgi:hypothetical protein
MAANTARVSYDDIPVLRKPNVAILTPPDKFAADVTRAISGPGKATPVAAPTAAAK